MFGGGALGVLPAGGGVGPGRVVHGVVVVGAQVQDHCIGRPGVEAAGLLRAQRRVVRAVRQAADGVIIGHDAAAGVVVPAGQQAPPALADDPPFGPQGVGGHPGAVVHRAEERGDPVLLAGSADGAFAAGDAVAHKFQPVRRLWQGQKVSAGKAQAGEQQVVVRVAVHGLHVLQHTDVLGDARGHPPAQGDFAAAGLHRKARDPRAVQLHADPGLVQSKAGLHTEGQLAAGKDTFKPAGRIKQRDRPGVVRLPAQQPDLRKRAQRQCLHRDPPLWLDDGNAADRHCPQA